MRAYDDELLGQKSFPSPKMSSTSPVPLKDQKEKSSLLIEVATVEKQLWTLVHAKGILHSGVQDLYRKVCSSYEKILLNDHQLEELQDVEYCLWKLHYRHIDEFRKNIKRSSGNYETAKLVAPQISGLERSSVDHIEGFKLFLEEAAKFYRSLISKAKGCCGLSEDVSFYTKTGRGYGSFETERITKLQFLCHRFLVCLGDLARYREQCEKSDVQRHNWSAAAKYYLEATMTWPDSGNPHNQLAVLATYVGDEFLALYHCIRSLAVKDPFPDAWNNLILLFERNRLSHLPALSHEAWFDFLKPSECSVHPQSQPESDSSNEKMVKAENGGLREASLWPLMIRMISFFFIESSLEDINFTFASTMIELDALMALDNVKLKAAMESYQLMDSIRVGAFRAIQAVSILIFVIENLIRSPEVKSSDNKNEEKQLTLAKIALTTTLIFMGRFVCRCLRENLLDTCPLLPALLVFVEWLAGVLHEIEAHLCDEKCNRALSYFCGVFVELLERFDVKTRVDPPGSLALWEDYELRGFAPLARVHFPLDFSTDRGYADSFESGNEWRMHRIVNAAMKIAEGSHGNWILLDRPGRKFYVAGVTKIPVRKESGNGELHRHISTAAEEGGKLELKEKLSSPQVLQKSVAVEDEEVILFKPLTRYNSAPLHNYMAPNEKVLPRDIADADECLRRATSLLIAQSQASECTSPFHSDLTNFRCHNPSERQEPLVNDRASHPFSEGSALTGSRAGPPSLNAWVLDKGSVGSEWGKGRSDRNRSILAPIEEVVPESFSDLSIGETEDLVISSGHESATSHYHPSPVYLSPAPSAPFLPDNYTWYTDYNGSGISSKTNHAFDAPQVSGYPNWTASHQPLDYGPGLPPGFIDEYAPTRRLSSSEWLRQYRESQNHHHVWPVPPYAVHGNPGNFYSHDMSWYGPYDQWGTPLAHNPLHYTETPHFVPGFLPAHGSDEYRREKPFQGYHRVSPYGCGGLNEPEPLLQYLKEKERRLQQDPSLMGPYVGR